MEGDGLCDVLVTYGPGTATRGCVLWEVRCGRAGDGLRRGKTERIVVSVRDYRVTCVV